MPPGLVFLNHNTIFLSAQFSVDVVFCHFKYNISVSSSLEGQRQKSTKNLLGYFHVMLATLTILCILFSEMFFIIDFGVCILVLFYLIAIQVWDL